MKTKLAVPYVFLKRRREPCSVYLQNFRMIYVYFLKSFGVRIFEDICKHLLENTSKMTAISLKCLNFCLFVKVSVMFLRLETLGI